MPCGSGSRTSPVLCAQVSRSLPQLPLYPVDVLLKGKDRPVGRGIQPPQYAGSGRAEYPTDQQQYTTDDQGRDPQREEDIECPNPGKREDYEEDQHEDAGGRKKARCQPGPLGYGGHLHLGQLDLLVDELLKLGPQGVDDLLDTPVGRLGTLPEFPAELRYPFSPIHPHAPFSVPRTTSSSCSLSYPCYAPRNPE